MNCAAQLAWAFMREQPGAAMQLGMRKALGFWWFPTRLTCPRCHSGMLLTPFHHPEKLVWLPLALLALVGIGVQRGRWRQWAILVTPLFSYTGLYAHSNRYANIDSNSDSY